MPANQCSIFETVICLARNYIHYNLRVDLFAKLVTQLPATQLPLSTSIVVNYQSTIIKRNVNNLKAPASEYTRYPSSPRWRHDRIALGPVGPSVLYENISASGWRPRGDIKYCTRTRVQYFIPPARLRGYLYIFCQTSGDERRAGYRLIKRNKNSK